MNSARDTRNGARAYRHNLPIDDPTKCRSQRAGQGALDYVRGVNQQTATNFVRFGATALGIGAELVPQEALGGRKEDQIRELARRFLAMVRDGRAQRLGKS